MIGLPAGTLPRIARYQTMESVPESRHLKNPHIQSGDPPASLLLQHAKGSRKNKFTFWPERRAGRCKAPRRRQCSSLSRSGNAADARPAPRPEGRLARTNQICYESNCHVYYSGCRPQNV